MSGRGHGRGQRGPERGAGRGRHTPPAAQTKGTCKTKYKMSPSSVRSEGGEAAAGYCLNSVSYRVDEAVKYNVLNSD